LNSEIHDRNSFDCGNAELNQWLATVAAQHQQKNISRTYVAVDIASPATILGFYSLTVSEVDGNNFPNPKRLPHRVPVVRLGRLAVAIAYPGKGFGGFLRMNALERVREIAHHAGVVVIVVEAKDEQAAAFYAKYQFMRSPLNPLRLVLYTATLQNMRGGNAGEE